MNTIAQAAVKAITNLRPSIKDGYKAQRVAEEASSKLVVPDPRCKVADMTVPAPDGHPIPIRVFTPLDLDFSLKDGLTASEDHKGTILFFHGGGWANGSVAFYTDSCTKMAIKLERRVVSVDYRRSPEHRFPTAVEDCYAVAKQLFAGQILPDVDPERLVLFGDSAGGNLAAVVSLLARERKDFTPSTQVLLYPVVYNDHSETSVFDSVRENGEDYLLTLEDIDAYVGMYVRDATDLQNPCFAPLLAPDLSHLPRTLVVSAEYCPLRDEDEVFAARLEMEGNQVECVRVLGAVHGYFLYPTVFGFVRDTYRIIESFLDEEPLPPNPEGSWLPILGPGALDAQAEAPDVQPGHDQPRFGKPRSDQPHPSRSQQQAG